jgi:hypothetical protein
MNPFILTIIITGILIISIHNLQLGLLLVVSLIALYYPKQKYNEIMIEENFTSQTLPIDKHDKNIVDEKKKSTKKDTKTTNKKNDVEEDFEDEEKDVEDVEEKDAEDDAEKDVEEKDVEEKDAEDEEDEEDENKISEMRLENLNPSLYKKKASENVKSKSSNNTTKTNKVVEKLTDLKKKTKTSGNEETFLGEVRQIVKDLDTGKNKMNANSAIKKISNLMYHKHKGDIQKIINTEESEEEEDDDEDLY